MNFNFPSSRDISLNIMETLNIFQQTIQTVQSSIRSCMAQHGIDPDSTPGLNEKFLEYTDPFNGLENKYKQEKYYQESLRLVENHWFYKHSCV